MPLTPPLLGRWWEDAACAQAPDKTIFDATEKEALDPYIKPRVIEALKYCAGCPVATECQLDAESDVYYPASGIRNGRYIPIDEAKKTMQKARALYGYEPVLNCAWVATARGENPLTEDGQ